MQQRSHRDPVLLERTIYAFGLLEAITRAGLPFVFKGGTCLMLLLKEPRRLSTDIDIVVGPGTDIDAYIEKAAKIFPFIRQEEQKRTGRNLIEKRHFRFTYDSPVNRKPFYILLDVLFERIQYPRTVEREIRKDLLKTEGESTKVLIPTIECILGDKLTAFAPHTNGIPVRIGKDMEVMKQLYDVSTLLDAFEDFSLVRETYWRIANNGSRIEDCLADTFKAALCIASRGKFQNEEYMLYVAGIRELRGHIYSENYTPEIAVGRAAKTAYMALCLLAGRKYEKLEDFRPLLSVPLRHAKLSAIRYLRKAAPEAYGYMLQADSILDEALSVCPDLFHNK
ncbi:MAG: nucleotidyl transferase AbiEii/AbiGii toxin family protein [Selenomonadaceae bacterium]|nr:nucleotidyl transferase AbiEii/AbiGii toxin family protein [Selenomonadaceae bacterium]